MSSIIWLAHPLKNSILLLFYLNVLTTTVLTQTNEFVLVEIYTIWNIHIWAYDPDLSWNPKIWIDPFLPRVYAQAINWYHCSGFNKYYLSPLYLNWCPIINQTRLKLIKIKYIVMVFFNRNGILRFLYHLRGMRPIIEQSEAILNINPPKDKWVIKIFINIINYYRDM